jgi:pimeloyl-ACP methyl ester carboxylesterase
MAEQIPGARLTTVPGAGHLSNLEQPETFNEIVAVFASTCAKS